MEESLTKAKPNKTKKGGSAVPTLCRLLGALILLVVIAVCLPITVPRFMGYQIFNVISGSMEPAIPVGSAVFVKEITPSEVQKGDIIAYASGDSVVMHRVMDNFIVERYFITKGDANEIEDLEEIPYEALVGIVEKHYPQLGEIFVLLSSGIGKACMLCLAGCGALLMMLGGRLAEEQRQKLAERAAREAASSKDSGQTA